MRLQTCNGVRSDPISWDKTLQLLTVSKSHCHVSTFLIQKLGNLPSHKCICVVFYCSVVKCELFFTSRKVLFSWVRHLLVGRSKATCPLVGSFRGSSCCYPSLSPVIPQPPRVYPHLSDISCFSEPSLSFYLYQAPRSEPKRPWSIHFPRLLVFNTQCIIKQIPHPDRKKIEQLIRLELSQFMAKLKRVPTMDKSRKGRKSMTGRTGVSPRFSRSAGRWESVAEVLPYLHMIFPVLPAHLLCDSVKTMGIIWDWRSMSQCEALSIIICSHQPKPCPLRLYELPNKLRSLITRTFFHYPIPSSIYWHTASNLCETTKTQNTCETSAQRKWR